MDFVFSDSTGEGRTNLYANTHLHASLVFLSLVYMHNIHPDANIHPGCKFAPGVHFGHINRVL